MSNLSSNLAIGAGLLVMAHIVGGTNVLVQASVRAPSRAPQSSLDGAWYRTADDSGCFQDTIVFELNGPTINGRFRGDLHPMPGWAVEPHGDWVRMRVPLQLDEPDPALIVWLRDQGERLDASFVEIDGARVPLTDQAHDVARCSNPSIWGSISRLWRTSYQRSNP